jgi:hypothetical protein
MAYLVKPAYLVDPVTPLGYDGADFHALKAAHPAGVDYAVLANTLADRVLAWQNLWYDGTLAAHLETVRWTRTIPAGQYAVLNGTFIWMDIPADGFAYSGMRLNTRYMQVVQLIPTSPLPDSTVSVSYNWLLPTGSVVDFVTRHTCTVNVRFRGMCHLHYFPIV